MTPRSAPHATHQRLAAVALFWASIGLVAVALLLAGGGPSSPASPIAVADADVDPDCPGPPFCTHEPYTPPPSPSEEPSEEPSGEPSSEPPPTTKPSPTAEPSPTASGTTTASPSSGASPSGPGTPDPTSTEVEPTEGQPDAPEPGEPDEPGEQGLRPEDLVPPRPGRPAPLAAPPAPIAVADSATGLRVFATWVVVVTAAAVFLEGRATRRRERKGAPRASA